MRRIATMIVTTAALLAFPVTALADETVSVNGGKLNFAGQAGQIDTLEVSDATGTDAGKHLVRESSSPTLAPGLQCTAGGSDTAVCGSVSSLILATLDLDDVITVSASLPGRLDAGDGNDTVNGGPGSETVIGGEGSDVLNGGLGLDWVYGGNGNDRIDVRDGVIDFVDCGPGDDRATSDPFDLVINCEAPPATPQPAGAPLDATGVPPVPTASVPGRTLPVGLAGPVGLVQTFAAVASDGRAGLGLSCDAVETAGCAGVAYLDPAPATRAARGQGGRVSANMSRRGRYGKSSFSIAAGRSKQLGVKLSPEARRALGLATGKRARAARRGRRVKAVVTVVQRGRASARSIVELRS